MDEFILSIELSVSAKQLYSDWLSSERHTAFTGSEASIEPVEGAKYSAWDGYISGEILKLDDTVNIFCSRHRQ